MSDPLVQALVDRLPSETEPFPTRDRHLWMQTMANVFDLVYGQGDSPQGAVRPLLPNMAEKPAIEVRPKKGGTKKDLARGAKDGRICTKCNKPKGMPAFRVGQDVCRKCSG